MAVLRSSLRGDRDRTTIRLRLLQRAEERWRHLRNPLFCIMNRRGAAMGN